VEVSHQKGAYGDEAGAEFPYHPSFLGSLEASEFLCVWKSLTKHSSDVTVYRGLM
jgi:hypothetical protein